MFRWLRNSFLTGVVVALPVAVTVWLIVFAVNFVDSTIKPLIPPRYNPESYLPFAIPGLGLVIAVVALTLLGALAANIFGRTLLGLGERILNTVPLVRNIYGAVKQIAETVFSGTANSFKEVVLVEYPKQGLYSVAFVSSSGRGQLKSYVGGDDVIGLFIPTTPNPTSGYLLYTRRENTYPLDMSVEEAAKLIISFGLVTKDKLPEPVREKAEAEIVRRTDLAEAEHDAIEAATSDRHADQPERSNLTP